MTFSKPSPLIGSKSSLCEVAYQLLGDLDLQLNKGPSPESMQGPILGGTSAKTPIELGVTVPKQHLGDFHQEAESPQPPVIQGKQMGTDLLIHFTYF